MSSFAPSDSVPQIFDRARLLVNRRRHARAFYEHDFLHRQIAQELAQRLALFKQDFKTALCIGKSALLREALLKPAQITTLYGSDIGRDIDGDIGGDIDANAALILDEEHLPLAAASCDLIVSFMGLHNTNDMVGAMRQMRNALAPDGVFLAALPAGRTLQELRTAFLTAESDLLGGVHPHIHPFADLRDLGDLLQRAGFALPIADSEIITIDYTKPEQLLYDLRGMGESNILYNRQKRFLRRDVLARTLQLFQEGGCKATFEICYLVARAPHENQPKPLQRGSATTSFAQALKNNKRQS